MAGSSGVHLRELADDPKIIDSVEKHRLKSLLKERLIECGWRDAIKDECRKLVKERGYENVTVDQLVKDVVPLARVMVPDSVKNELLEHIRGALKPQ